MPAFTSDSGMIAGGGPAGTIARRRTPPPAVDTGVDTGAARDDAASNDRVSAVRREKPARRTKP